MILPRLKVLLAERNLKISRVSNDTGLSRTTLTSLTKNTLKGVQLETIDTLCQYLGIPIKDFFEFVPFGINVNCMFPDIHKDFSINLNATEAIKVMPFEADLYLIKQSNSRISGIEKTTFTLTARINTPFLLYSANADMPFGLPNNTFTSDVEILLGQSDNKNSFKAQEKNFNNFIDSLSDSFLEEIFKKIKSAFMMEMNEQFDKFDVSLPDFNFKFTFNDAFLKEKFNKNINISLVDFYSDSSDLVDENDPF